MSLKKHFTLLICLLSFSAWSAPKSELWELWDHGNPNSQKTISHQAWQTFLSLYLVRDGEHQLVNYSGVSEADKQALGEYIKHLATHDPKAYSRAEQYAYWVNMYNAITVKLILDEYPVKSITKLGGLFSFGPWDDEVVTVNGQALTLNDIEHRILRPIWKDPRTHYAVNCASLGCPNLQPEAFSAENSERLLESAARAFINSDKGARVTDKGLELSSIYEWFEEDFGGNETAVLEHLRKYRPDLPEAAGRISYDYDWSLNEAAP